MDVSWDHCSTESSSEADAIRLKTLIPFAMAAVDSSPPGGGSVTMNSVHQRGIPSNPSSPKSLRIDKQKQLPRVPMPEGSRLGHSPVSPVKMNFQPENWAQPSTATIERRGPSHYANYETSSAPVADGRSYTVKVPARPPPSLPVEISQPQGTVRRVAESMNADSMFGSDFSAQLDLSIGGSSLSPTAQSNSSYHEQGAQRDNRHSRETNTSASTPSLSNPHTSTDTSVVTSVSSVSNEIYHEQERKSEDASTANSSIEDPANEPQMVPQLQYHHQPFSPKTSSFVDEQNPRAVSTPDLSDSNAAVNRHLTPVSNVKRNSLPRPRSTYSIHSERGRASVLGGSSIRAPSAHSSSRRSPNIDNRQSTYAELLNVPYPQPAPAPLTIDNSQLRTAIGANASLLSSQTTLDMYRQNVKKTNDFSIQYSFAVFLISTAQDQGLDLAEPKKKTSKPGHSPNGSYSGVSDTSPHDLVREARAILQKLANAGYPFAQYYLADGYASGLFSKGKEDYNSAFPLFVLAAKHGHAESAYRTGLCYEFGWGCRKDPAKAVQFLRTAASKRHPGAMTRLGKACLSGDLGEKRYREGLKWLKLATESADTMYNAAPFHLGCLYETGYGADIFKDEGYAADLFTQAAELGHPEASFRMGDAYEHGKLNCPRDPSLSVHFYTGAAERGHAGAMMGLCAWYMVGAEPILEKDEEEACEWARRSAECGEWRYISQRAVL